MNFSTSTTARMDTDTEIRGFYVPATKIIPSLTEFHILKVSRYKPYRWFIRHDFGKGLPELPAKICKLSQTYQGVCKVKMS
ncbi:uncharacterized protein EAE98_010720 [Botrytis deweyae]|uniref:Uncharacterized protein n=2 Tax=Botrytis TaxID=33196 RepID=A0A4Z1JHP0_9HELO|nr:uncharacterized protein EAE98_010720 [Botrytis deweyae]KAF7916420.1 hypothetical protein EAE98_010720 [Botrytis deweyae]TGO73068.1 hypothetical protein BELL_0394g00090 [Botrytis elliptica]